MQTATYSTKKRCRAHRHVEESDEFSVSSRIGTFLALPLIFNICSISSSYHTVSSRVFGHNLSLTSRSPLHLQRCLDPSFPSKSWTWPLRAVGKNRVMANHFLILPRGSKWMLWAPVILKISDDIYKSYHLLHHRANPPRTDLTYWRWSQRCRP